MITRVRVSSDVSHPDIKACICQDVRQTLVTEVGEPVGGGAEEAMLKEDNWKRNVACGDGGRERESEGQWAEEVGES